MKILSRVAASILALAIFLSASGVEAVWRLDGIDSEELPRNFRLIPNENLSASGQPSRWNLKILYDTLRDVANTGAKIYIVDLRQEPHGLANGYPVSWYVDRNRANYYRGNDEIESDELERLNDILDTETKFVPLGKYDTEHYQTYEFAVMNVETERQAANDIGFEYVRLGATDMMFPAPGVVDEFISLLNVIDAGDWIHLHCQAGHGRTTTFAAIYEILTNPDKPLEEICNQQYNLGGSNLLAGGERTDKIRLFYRYARESLSRMSWSEFLMEETD